MNPEQLLKEGLIELGLSYSQEQINFFMTYLSKLKRWNKAYALTALKSDEDIIIKHFLDSLLYLKAISKESLQFTVHGSQLKICDVGTGAGFPGIPIKIIEPDMDITLIEPSRKKSAFLRHIIRVLKLANSPRGEATGITVLEQRLENLGMEYEKTYDAIISRAAFKIKDFVKMACPYIKEDGILVLSKGPKTSEEMVNNYFIKKILRFKLPFVKVERNLVVLKCQF